MDILYYLLNLKECYIIEDYLLLLLLKVMMVKVEEILMNRLMFESFLPFHYNLLSIVNEFLNKSEMVMKEKRMN